MRGKWKLRTSLIKSINLIGFIKYLILSGWPWFIRKLYQLLYRSISTFCEDKGSRDEMKIFLMASLSNRTFCVSVDGFRNTVFCCLFVEKIKIKVSACFYEIAYTNSANLSSNLLQEACFSFQVADCNSKNCSESRLWLKNIFRKLAMTYCIHWRKFTKTVKESQNRNSAISRTIFRNSMRFQRSKRNFLTMFPFTQDLKIFRTICASKV